jgi:hypothetical protein
MKVRPLECPYCGPFQRCQADEPAECWAATDDAEPDEIFDEREEAS